MDEVILTYVTGRDQKLVKEAILQYGLPLPGYVISDVGTKIYRIEADGWQELFSWREKIAVDWKGQNWRQLREYLREFPELRLQESCKQSECKLSFYFPVELEPDVLIKEIGSRLKLYGIQASLIPSIDEAAGTGLLDILPAKASKLEAILFLREYLGLHAEQIVFAGDSGNDLDVLISPVQSILVANAGEKIKRLAVEGAVKNGCRQSLFVAEESFPLGGNYAAGVLQGVQHYYPDFMDKLDIL